jgi:hypothetical protein
VRVEWALIHEACCREDRRLNRLAARQQVAA